MRMLEMFKHHPKKPEADINKAPEDQTVLSKMREVASGKLAKAVNIVLFATMLTPSEAFSASKNNPDRRAGADTKGYVGGYNVTPEQAKNYQSAVTDFNFVDYGKDEKPENAFLRKETADIEAVSLFQKNKDVLVNEAAFVNQFNKLLEKVTPENVQEFIDKDLVATVSSSEEEIKGGTAEEIAAGNFGLTLKREAAIGKIGESVLQKFNSKTLKTEEVKEIQEKKIIKVHPVGGKEEGVTYLKDLINPATKQKFTTEELSALPENERQELLKKCRFVKFETKAKELLSDIKDFAGAAILWDNSQSSDPENLPLKNVVKVLNGLNINVPIDIVPFSNKAGAAVKVTNTQEAAKVIAEIPLNGNENEKAFSSTIEYLTSKISAYAKAGVTRDKMPRNGVYVFSNEAIQDAQEVVKLGQLSYQSNTKINFILFDEFGKNAKKIDYDKMKDFLFTMIGQQITDKKNEYQQELADYTKKSETLIDQVIKNRQEPGIASYLAAMNMTGSDDAVRKQLAEINLQTETSWKMEQTGEPEVIKKLRFANTYLINPKEKLADLAYIGIGEWKDAFDARMEFDVFNKLNENGKKGSMPVLSYNILNPTLDGLYQGQPIHKK